MAEHDFAALNNSLGPPQCRNCGLITNRAAIRDGIVGECYDKSVWAPRVVVEALEAEIRELRALVTPSDPGSLPLR